MKILFIEDSDSDIEAFHAAVKVLIRRDKLDIEHHDYKSVKDALSALDNSFDGAIVDLRLVDGSGESVISEVHRKYRIPVVVFTGTPAEVGKEQSEYLKVFTKGADTYIDAISYLRRIYATGITRIMGMRGIIEKSLDDIFWTALIPNMTEWMGFEGSEQDAESSMLRHIAGHIADLLGTDTQSTAPECYVVYSAPAPEYKTGEILSRQNGGGHDYYMVLTPACDLVIRSNGRPKSDKLLVCKIESQSKVVESATDGVKAAKKAGKVKEALKNNHAMNLHWLPAFSNFPGGFLDFRQLDCRPFEDAAGAYHKVALKVSAPFLKDVVSRFSSYYARQGQPDLHLDAAVEKLLA